MRKRSILIFLLACFLTLPFMSDKASAAHFEGDGWYIDKGCLYLTGEITMNIIYSPDNPNVKYEYSPWYAYKDMIVKVVALEGASISNGAGLFSEHSYLTSADLQKLDVSNVILMDKMFINCGFLTNVNVSGWDTSHVRSFRRMFEGCSALFRIDLSGWNTSNVHDMQDLFHGCTTLYEVHLDGWDTSNVKYWDSMFKDCENLRHLDLHHFRSVSAIEMANAFSGCENLITLDISGFTTTDRCTANCLFFGCSNLTTLKLGQFNTKNVFLFNSMFTGCSQLEELDLSNFDTSSAVNLGYMFYGCTNLKKLDIRNFDVSKDPGIRDMFGECENISNLALSNALLQKISDQVYALQNEWIDVNTNQIYRSANDLLAAGTKVVELALIARTDRSGWAIDNLGNLHIYGTVNNTSTASVDQTPWKAYKNQIRSVVISADASISNGNNLFANCPLLKKVVSFNKNLDLSTTRIDQSVAVWSYLGGAVENYAKKCRLEFHALLPFTDVKEGTWQYNTAYYVYVNRLMQGTGETTFSPNQKMSRAQFIVVLWRMEGEKRVAFHQPYSDVLSTHYAATAIQWGKDNGLIMGYGDGTFKPNDQMSRQQFMAFMQRYAKYKGYDVSTKGTTYTKCADANLVSPTFAGVVEWAYERGFIGATGKLSPRGDISRIEAAAVIERFDKYYK